METRGPVSLAEWAGQWQLPPAVLSEAAAVALAAVDRLVAEHADRAECCGCNTCRRRAAVTVEWASAMLAES